MIDLGRVEYVKSLSSHKFGVNVGCGKTRFDGKINFDITREADIDVLGDARFMPFRDGAFDEIFFFEAFEHISNRRGMCLKEIERTLKKNGRLVMSVPYDCLFSRVQDYLYWDGNHKHFTKSGLLKELTDGTSLKIDRSFNFGTIPNLFERILRVNVQLPSLSGTLFVIAKKESLK
jgi:SAM-dependent methyltransferase